LSGTRSDFPVDHALTLFMADDTEAALRWGAAALERNPWTPETIILTSQLLEQMGRTRAAVDGLLLAVQRSIDAGDLPLAVVAIDHLRALGVDVGPQLDELAGAFCQGSSRLGPLEIPSPPSGDGDFQPLSPLLSGPALASKATQILLSAKRADELLGEDLAPIAPVPLFSALSKESLRDLLATFTTMTVPAGHRVIQEGKDSAAAYIVASGTLEVSRKPPEGSNKPRTILARVGGGSLVGEIALLSHLPSAVSVTATRPCILLVAKRQAIDPIAAKHPDVGVELAAHARRHAVANLGWESALATAVPAQECGKLVERLETRTFDRGEKLVAHGEETQGLHLIVSGEVAVVAREGGGRVMLATRLAGDTVGEVELVLCQKANVDAIAVRATATLLLPPEEFFALVRDHPATLHGLYAIAVRRHNETRLALEAWSPAMIDDPWIEEMTGPSEREPAAPARLPEARRDFPFRPTEARHTSLPPNDISTSPTVPLPSIPPTSATFAPPRSASSGGPTSPAARLLRAGALLAAVAGVAFVIVAVRDRRFETESGAFGSTRGHAASLSTATAVETATAAPAPAPIAIAPAPEASAPVKPAPPKPVIARPRVTIEPRGTAAAAVAAPAPASSAVAAVASTASSALPAPRPLDAKPSSPSAASSVGEFGGRE
jgi:CRP-like cAMP-binding protein